MSSSEKHFFTILEKINKSSFKIQEMVPKSVEEIIEIAESGPAKIGNYKPIMVFKTTQERRFARIEGWPKDLLFEITPLKNSV